MDLIEEIKKIIKSEKLDIDLNLSDDLLIQEFIDKVDWDCFTVYENLSENFIERFQDDVDWNYISQFQTLSEEFIERFKDKVHWVYITINQKLSERFIYKYWLKGLSRREVILFQESLTPDFLWWLYKTDQIELYDFLLERTKNQEIKEYGNMIESQIPKVLIEF